MLGFIDILLSSFYTPVFVKYNIAILSLQAGIGRFAHVTKAMSFIQYLNKCLNVNLTHLKSFKTFAIAEMSAFVFKIFLL